MKPDIRIFKDFEELSWDAARLFVERAAHAIAERGHFLVALNGGNTPERFFQLLASDFRENVDWSKTHIFWGDERCVPASDPGSSYGQARDLFLRRVPIKESNIHRIKGELAAADAAQDYDLTLKEFASHPMDFPRFDLVYLGIGEDGHTASLFPGTPALNVADRWTVENPVYKLDSVRLTLTVPVLNAAKKIIFLVAGEGKARALKEILGGDADPHEYPAKLIRPKGRTVWMVDRAAAQLLD